MQAAFPWLYKALGLNSLYKAVWDRLDPIPEGEEYEKQRLYRTQFTDDLMGHSTWDPSTLLPKSTPRTTQPGALIPEGIPDTPEEYSAYRDKYVPKPKESWADWLFQKEPEAPNHLESHSYEDDDYNLVNV
jgi:hypothetical protein